MNCITPNSRKGLVNKFAEILLKEINKDSNILTHLEVTDFINFYVVKGETESKEVLDINKIKNSFFQEHQSIFESYNIKNFNIIDVIKYDVTPIPKHEYYFEFYNSNRPIYNQEVINNYENYTEKFKGISSLKFTDKLEVEFNWPIYPNFDFNVFSYTTPMTISSEFPFGYSFGMGKSEFFYCEYICNQLFSVTNSEKIIFKITNQVDKENDLKINVTTDSKYNDEVVKSMLLDVFDFNLTKFTTEKLKGYDFTDEISKPFDTKPWLVRDMVKEMLIF